MKVKNPGQREMNLFTPLELMCQKYPDKPAVIYLGTQFSYSKLKELIERFATALYDLGIGGGDRVMIYLPNCPQWFISYFGAQKIGAICVPITPIYVVDDVEYIANDAEAKAIVCADTNFGYVKQVLPKTALRKVIVTNLVDLLPWYKRAFGKILDRVPEGHVSRDKDTYFFRELIGRYPPQPPSIEVTGDQLAYLLYTGGTTGFPKGVPGTHRFFLNSILDMMEMHQDYIREGEHKLAQMVPLFHIMGQLIALATSLYKGNPLVLLPRVNLDGLFEAIQRYILTLMIGVPTLYRMILEHDRVDLYDLSSLKYCFCGGDVLPFEVYKRWQQKFKIPIYQIYGSTEVSTVSLSPLDREPPSGSIGKLLPSQRTMIIDPDTLEPVPLNEVGELLVTTDYMMDGYWKKPEETAQSFIKADDRVWYRMGDLVRMDEEGQIYFEDRKVDMIKTKGYRVAAAEVERVLQDHPAVIATCAVGVPHPVVGERIKAFVVLKEDARGVTAHDLIRWCRERLAAYKVPDYIEFRDMLPKSKVGKLLRREMRDEERRRVAK